VVSGICFAILTRMILPYCSFVAPRQLIVALRCRVLPTNSTSRAGRYTVLRVALGGQPRRSSLHGDAFCVRACRNGAVVVPRLISPASLAFATRQGSGARCLCAFASARALVRRLHSVSVGRSIAASWSPPPNLLNDVSSGDCIMTPSDMASVWYLARVQATWRRALTERLVLILPREALWRRTDASTAQCGEECTERSLGNRVETAIEPPRGGSWRNEYGTPCLSGGARDSDNPAVPTVAGLSK
jgi:hypothetical protein